MIHSIKATQRFQSVSDFTFSLVLSGLGMAIPNWDFLGTTMVTANYIRLTPDAQSMQGALWNSLVSRCSLFLISFNGNVSLKSKTPIVLCPWRSIVLAYRMEGMVGWDRVRDQLFRETPNYLGRRWGGDNMPANKSKRDPPTKGLGVGLWIWDLDFW